MPNDDDKAYAPTVSRLSRFTKLTGLGASVAARHLKEKVVSAFTDDENAAQREKAAQKKTAQQVTKTLGELKGAAMKLGQMLATDPELLPPEMVQELSRLQHSAPPMDFSTVAQQVEEALGRPLCDLFADFSQEPIGAASIGQVHRAVTKEGLRVAVKVQYPGIASTIRSDMQNLGSLLLIARAQLPKERVDAYLQEVTQVIERESDYLNEAANLERFQVILKNVEGVRVPIPVHELTRRTVLTMELFEGERLEDWLQHAPREEREVQVLRLLRAYLEMIHEHGVLHADPHAGNFLVITGSQPEFGRAEYIGVPPVGVLDLGCVRDYDLAFTDDLLRFLRALWRHDLDALQATWRRLGFMDDSVDPELVYEWCALVFEPLLKNRVTDFNTWKVHDSALRFVLDNPSIKLWAPPREVLFYVRVLAGIRALLAKANLQLNVYELSRDVVRRRNML